MLELESEINEEVLQSSIDTMLLPYLPHCRYLKSASIHYSEGKLSSSGRFEIPESCYIKSTGHFNATEFIFCFNQLGYVMFGEGIEKGLMPEIGLKSREDFQNIQLKDCYIAQMKEIKFKRPINPRSFTGDLRIANHKRMGNVFYSIDAEFRDALGGSAKGNVLISVLR
ncbi:FcoT family thioesterase [Candidatus Pacearchaeota archaeon]|nr:FcoT family thioesterase [Candidatus Pacearchaeota archaeon]